MAKVLVLYYSSFGHMEQMAKAAAEGAREAGAQVTIKRVPELVPEEVARMANYKLDQEAEVAKPEELENYDAIIVASATRYGAIASQMKNFLDQTGPLWARGALLNKVGSVMVSTATQHGGAELALVSTQAALQHHGMIIVPLSYAYQGQMGNDVVRGGAPYGMTTTSDSDGSRQPSMQELEGARFQGRRVAEIAAKLYG
ncbi:MAG: NAD(P)H:quinone oxidoreductase [Proteobacteria bacterium]|nr:MAG: NAD(P)H:quinone oxidoreductase [Pseudomonadota bacterium]